MRHYDVYRHELKGYEAVKQGISWPGFFFTFIWALIKQLWLPGLAIILALLFIGLITSIIDIRVGILPSLAMLLIQLAFYFYIGLRGNDWRRSNLVKRGFHKMGTVLAKSPTAAIQQINAQRSAIKQEITA